jgi:DNA gyrase/topoisomerase IV subunit A
LSTSTIGTRKKRKQKLALTFLSISLFGFLTTTTVLNTTKDAFTQTTTSSEAEKKKDIFKVIMTVQGLDHNSGDIVTIVTVNGESRVKLFDDNKTYIHSVNTNGTGGLIEYTATFPNMTVNVGDEYKVCALAIKHSNLICQTGNNSPALRPEFIDLYMQEEKPSTTSQAAILGEE